MSFSLGGMAKTALNQAQEPIKTYNFRVILHPDFGGSGGILGAMKKIAGGIGASFALGSFSSVEGVGWKTEVHTVREGGVNDCEHRLPGRTTCNELVFSKGLTLLDPMWDWYHSTISGSVSRMNGTIFLMTDYHTPTAGISAVPSTGIPTAAWHFFHAFPTALEGARMDASQSAIAIQHLTVSIDRIEKVGLPVGGLGALAADAVAGTALSIAGSLL
jgi:phage tail-like protein